MSHVDIRFTDKNSERFMLARRVYKVIEDLENEYLYPDSETLGGFKFRDGQYKFSQIDEGEWTDFDSENDYWGYKEDYAWFRQARDNFATGIDVYSGIIMAIIVLNFFIFLYFSFSYNNISV